MPIIKTEFPDLLIFDPVVWEDSRGYFYESYNKKTFIEQGLQFDFIQDNQASSAFGVIRGLHYQLNPHAQTKLIRVIKGNILDVAVDIRVGSPMFGKVFIIELSEANKKQLLIPKGFAHGYSVISKTAEVFYKCDHYFNKSAEAGIAFDDRDLDIKWGVISSAQIISEKDKHYPTLHNSINNFMY